MAAPSSKAAKLLCLSAFAGLLLASSTSAAFSSPMAAAGAPAPVKSIAQGTVAASGTLFLAEQAMSPTQLLDRWSPFIKEASRRFGVAEDWIRAVMRMESGGRTALNDKRPITSSAGAMGIMQLMPDTYRDMRQQFGLGANPYDPHDNVIAGTAYLRWLYGKYGYPKMFAAYNAGPGTVEAQAAGARQLPSETRAYVKGIAHILGDAAAASESPKFVAANVPATLTRPDGSLVSIDGAKVDSIRASLPDEYAPGVRTVVAMGPLHQGVREDLATVASLLRTHGAKV
jgi:soluble lytic murein transglycosylase-like protein